MNPETPQETFTATKTVKKGNISKTIRVEKVENGYIICIEKSGRDKKDNYQYSEKKYISSTNPLDEKESNQEIGNEKNLADSLKNFLGGTEIELD